MSEQKTPKKRGQPCKAVKADKYVKARVTEKEQTEITTHAKARGFKSTSAWLRALIDADKAAAWNDKSP